jgi:geranylgeranyl transferase type-2 subunit alpha
MFHGVKKQKPKQLTPEQIQQRDEKLIKIKLVNSKMLKQRSDRVYDEASLLQTEKFAKLSPDFNTVWNYRREILEHLFAKGEGKFAALNDKLDIVTGELKMLVQ